MDVLSPWYTIFLQRFILFDILIITILDMGGQKILLLTSRECNFDMLANILLEYRIDATLSKGLYLYTRILPVKNDNKAAYKN
jgi:hypothetical protein